MVNKTSKHVNFVGAKHAWLLIVLPLKANFNDSSPHMEDSSGDHRSLATFLLHQFLEPAMKQTRLCLILL